MLLTDPESRPSVDDIIDLPKLKLRLQERETRDEYNKLRAKEQQITAKMEEMKKREEDIAKREEELKEREQRAFELRLKISQSSFKLNNGLY